MIIRNWLPDLQEWVLEQAKKSLREGDSEAYKILTEFAGDLQKLAPYQKQDYQRIEIFSKNGQHRAELVTDFVAQRKNKCVIFNGQPYSPSGIASELMGYAIDGWFWWQYHNDRGETRDIDDFRK
jgi:hypothetical protein